MAVEPSKLVGAVAAGLGFAPESSLVVVSVRGATAVTVLRVDLKDAGDVLDPLAEQAARAGVPGVVAVVVDKRRAECPGCVEQFGSLCRDLDAALRSRGLTLKHSFVVDRVEAGGRWFDLADPARAGVITDPARSMVGSARTSGGRLFGSRDELVESVVAVDQERVAALEKLLAGCGAGSGGVGYVETAVRSVVALVKRQAVGAALSDGELAAAGAVLADVRVRDVLFTLVESEELAWPAEQLWSLLARVLPLPLRAEALTLLAFSAYIRGAALLVGIAAEAVLAEQPEHRMAGMLLSAVNSGMPSQQVRTIIAKTPAATSM